MAKRWNSSEHGLGGLIDEVGEHSEPLSVRIWRSVLGERGIGDGEVGELRAPARRRLPLNRPELLRPFTAFNTGKTYVQQVKPYGFLQTVTVIADAAQPNIRPIAPYAPTLKESRRLPWIDLHSATPVKLDWNGSGYAGTLMVQTLSELAHGYGRHPESKAAGPDGEPATGDTVGMLQRLHLIIGRPVCIGKEIDRLDEADGFNIEGELPVRYLPSQRWLARVRAALEAITPKAALAREIGLSERRLRDIEKGRAIPRPKTWRAMLRAYYARR